MPIINRYAEEGRTRKINGMQEVDKVFEDVKKALEGYL
jgi:adenylate kinase family enzyme